MSSECKLSPKNSRVSKISTEAGPHRGPSIKTPPLPASGKLNLAVPNIYLTPKLAIKTAKELKNLQVVFRFQEERDYEPQ